MNDIDPSLQDGEQEYTVDPVVHEAWTTWTETQKYQMAMLWRIAMLHPEKVERRAAQKKTLWSRDEDLFLKVVVRCEREEAGTVEWGAVADRYNNGNLRFPLRTKRQCRERYQCLVANRKQWTPVEETLLLDLYNEHGKQWKRIASLLGTGRDAVSVKNKYNQLQKRKCNEEPAVADFKDMDSDELFEDLGYYPGK